MKSAQNISRQSFSKVSLDNFNPYNQLQQIDSPRSIRACQRVGIHPSDLFVPAEKILQAQYQNEKQYAPNLTLDQYKNYAEIRRQKKVQMVQQMRKQVGRELKQEEVLRSTGHQTRSDMDFNKILEKENQHFQQREQIMIDKIRNRQKKEIAQMLNSEFKIQAIKDKAELKQQKMLKMEEQREQIFEWRRQQAEIKRQEMSQKLKYKEKLDSIKIKEFQKKAEVKEQAFQSSKKEKELIRLGMIESKEGYRKQKKIRLQEQIKVFQRQKEIAFKMQKEEIEKKEHQRNILIHSMYEQRKEVNFQKRIMYEQKLTQVRKFEKQKVENARQIYLQKEDANEKKQMELQRIKEMEILQKQSCQFQKSQVVQKNQKEVEKQILSKNLEYFQKMEKETMSVQSQLLQSKKIYDQSLASEIEKLMLKQNRPKSASTMNLHSAKDQDQLRDRLTHQLDERAEYIRTMQLLNQKQRALKEDIKFLQVRENQKIINNKRKQYLLANIQKIEATKKKLEDRELERQKIIQMRNDMQRVLSHEKEVLKDQFQKRSQKNNINLHQLAEMYGVEVRPQSR
ncbi:hypothetical protein TTHERM_000146184 (macronuclear) [Tetrahymena thermophila SB210]|uniref:Uncharacterized protein n=1 Tax=Tetrahymena thermophila (strain SB210) TaxID=312017 RepID=W7X8H4_TETTS|nr:hypothetical protein TTHERM_000146184 [Tetrahymena thermophila SB210]EWS75675.1 hypothetical protein TTHERM_000146184 [Tetrahymena thermophila SB210]|eukprot:XP_012651821.1 hypothetical protein TTHERM_000146184 [Tetrahymena thermophila SB210]